MRILLVIGIVATAAFLSTVSCEEKTGEGASTSTTTTTHIAKPIGKDCAVISSTEILQKSKQLHLPAIGRLVNEDHHTPLGTKQPTSTTDGMTKHLSDSCNELKQMGYQLGDCSSVYAASYQRKWTPAEGGGLVGEVAISTKPKLLEEMFLFNMYWTGSSRPPAGYKYLITNIANNQSVVVAGGYEVGPNDTSYLGGVSTEAHYFLKSNNETATLRVARLEDQSLPLGPITCEVTP